MSEYLHDVLHIGNAAKHERGVLGPLVEPLTLRLGKRALQRFDFDTE